MTKEQLYEFAEAVEELLKDSTPRDYRIRLEELVEEYSA